MTTENGPQPPPNDTPKTIRAHLKSTCLGVVRTLTQVFFVICLVITATKAVPIALQVDVVFAGVAPAAWWLMNVAYIGYHMAHEWCDLCGRH